MNIFDSLKDILYQKNGDLLTTFEDEQEFQPYMIQRWLSMYSPEMAKLVNLTFNRFYNAYDNKQEWYKAFLGIVPRSSFKMIKYIKKKGKEEPVNNDKQKKYEQVVQYLARTHEISKREVDIYIKEHNIELDSFVFN